MVAFVDFISAFSTTLLIVVGLYVSFGLLRVINMCHGEVAMVGAYVGATIINLKFSFVLAIIGGLIAGAALGAIISTFVLRSGNKPEFLTLLAIHKSILGLIFYTFWSYSRRIFR